MRNPSMLRMADTGDLSSMGWFLSLSPTGTASWSCQQRP